MLRAVPLNVVMPGLDPGIHHAGRVRARWIAGSSPAMTVEQGRNGCCDEPQLHPLVEPHVSHFKHVPFRTMVKFPHSEQLSPS